MANIKISDLSAATAAADANEFEINEAGTSKKVTGSQIKAYVNSGDGALAAKDTVATADIDNLAVTTAKLAADAVDGTKIADDAIDSEHYAAGSIDAEHIADSAVTAPKVAGASGTSGQVLQSDGDGTMSWLTLAAGGGFSNMEVFTSSGTWTNPGTVEKVKVTVVGGGGNGGAAPAVPGPNQGNFRGGGGGGAGGCALEVISIPSATNVPVTVGGVSGTSSFGAYCSATGGGTGGAGYNEQAGGAGGSGSGGTLNFQGEPGKTNQETGSAYAQGGHGGSSLFGGGGSYTTAKGPTSPYNPPGPARPGYAGTGYGSGGGGGASYSYLGAPGGAGKSGIVIVEY